MGILIRKSCPLVVQDIQTDDHGRFAALTCQWEGRVYNVVSIYIPPAIHNQAFPALGRLLLSLPQGKLIIGGDFNAVLDASQDKLPPRNQGITTTQLQDFVDAMGLVDTWRTHHPTERQYTHYFGAHNSMSRIDHIFTSTTSFENVQEITHLPRGISDHSPILAKYTSHSTGRRRIYPIYSGYLKVPEIRKNLHKTTKHYFHEKAQSVTSLPQSFEKHTRQSCADKPYL